MDWNATSQQAIAAAAAVFGHDWAAVQSSAEHSIGKLASTAQYIATSPEIPIPQQQLLISNQKLAMQNTLLGFKDVGIVVAEQAVASAWGVFNEALQAAARASVP